MSLSSEMFQPAVRQAGQAEAITRPSLTFWQDAWRRLKQNRLAMAGFWGVVIILLIAIIGPMLTPYSYSDQNFRLANKPPGSGHWFGTDELGRDLLTRVLYGARISLSVGIVAGAIQLAVGALYGAIAAMRGGRTDMIMMRIVDTLDTIPLTLYVILLMVILKGGLFSIFVSLGLVYWTTMARVVRAQVLSLKEQEFILAARTIGANRWRILFRHLIPNAIGPIIVVLTLSIPAAMFTEAFLSFIGLGVAAPMASWGVLANDGLQSIKVYPWQIFFPAAAISVTMLSFNFLGDGLRDALDPRMRR